MVSKRLENQTIPNQCNFKTSSKKNILESRSTIDQVHSKMLAEFAENDILGLQVKVMLKEQLNDIQPFTKHEHTMFEITLYKMVSRHKKGETDMIDYLLNLGMFLRDQELMPEQENRTTNKYTSQSVTDDRVPGGVKPIHNARVSKQKNSVWGTALTISESDNKGFMYRKFMSNVCNNEELDERCDDEMICSRCGGHRLRDIAASALVCPECGDSITYMDCTGLHYNMFTDTTIGCVQTYEYKRINQLNDWMSSFQGAKSDVISNEIILLVDGEIKKQRINKRELKPSDIKLILKKLKLNKYYEHTAAILARVTGTKPVSLPEETQVKIRKMFIQAETTFKTLPNLDRINFLSYSYLLHKFMQLVNRHDLCEYFPLLKSRQKLWAQEHIWKQICEKNGWRFIPSM